MTPAERKVRVNKLREEHEDYFQTIGNLNALYIPKMAYRPPGKDEGHLWDQCSKYLFCHHH